MKPNNKVLFAVVGCGGIGKAHIQSILDQKNALLCATIDVKKDQSIATGTPHFISIEEFLDSKILVDVVCICTPNGLHAEHAMKFIKNGRSVVIEKPMCLKSDDGIALIQEATLRGVQVFCVMQNRFTPYAQLLKKAISEEVFGDIIEIKVDLLWNRDKRYYFDQNGQNHLWHGKFDLDGGILYTQFTHFVDLIVWLFGEVELLHSFKKNINHSYVNGIEDTGFFTFLTQNDAFGTFKYSINAPKKNLESTIMIVGSKGYIKIEGQYLENLVATDIDEIYNWDFPQLNESTHFLMIKNVIDTLHQKTQIYTNALEGLKVVELIEEIYKKANKF